MNNKLKVGIIGTGYVSDDHAKGFSSIPDKCEIYAVADIVESKAKQKSKEWGTKKYYTDYIDLLNDENIDTVSICLPHHLHHEASIHAAKAGKHILIEKPLATTVKEAEDICNIVQDKKIKFMVAHNQIFSPAIMKAKEYVNNGYIGKTTMVNAYSISRLPLEKRSDWGWRIDPKMCGGGTLIDTGMHRIYLTRHFGGEVDSVTAHINNILFGDQVGMKGEDTASAIFKFKNGALGLSQVCIAGYNPSPIQEWIDIYGTEGSIKVITGYCLPHLMMSFGNQLQMFSTKLQDKQSQVNLWYLPESSYVNEIQHFIDCIINDKIPLVTAEDGKACIEIVQAAYKAACDGTTIKLPYKE